MWVSLEPAVLSLSPLRCGDEQGVRCTHTHTNTHTYEQSESKCVCVRVWDPPGRAAAAGRLFTCRHGSASSGLQQQDLRIWRVFVSSQLLSFYFYYYYLAAFFLPPLCLPACPTFYPPLFTDVEASFRSAWPPPAGLIYGMFGLVGRRFGRLQGSTLTVCVSLQAAFCCFQKGASNFPDVNSIIIKTLLLQV